VPGKAGRPSDFIVESLETRRLLSSISLVKGASGYPLYESVVAAPNGKLFFTLDNQLWVSDGTSAGTHSIPVNPGSQDLTLQGRFIFDGENIIDSSTAKALDFSLPESDVELTGFIALGDKLVISAESISSRDQFIFVRNSPTDTFREVPHDDTYSSIYTASNAFSYKGQPHFFVNGTLERIDSDANGDPVAHPVADLGIDDPNDFRDIDGSLYVQDSSGWLRTDGTAQGTNQYSTDNDPVEFNGTAWLTDNGDLLRVNPTTGQAEPTGAQVGTGLPTLIAAGGKLFSDGGSQSLIGQVWVSDGTSAGTHRISALDGVDVSSIYPADNGRIIALGNDPIHGTAFWITDGTTTTFIDVNPANTGNGPGFSYAGVGDAIYYFAESSFGDGFFRIDLKPSNHAPIAAIGAPLTVAEGQPLILDASASSDPDGDSLRYRWDLNGDGDYSDVSATSAKTSVSWARLRELGITDGPAVFTARLRVSDSSITKTSHSAVITVLNTVPRVKLSVPRQVLVNTDWPAQIRFTDSGVDTITSFTIDWGDGTIQKRSGNHATLTHRYVNAGTYSLKTSTVDEDGPGQSAPLTVTVVNALTGPSLLLSVAADASRVAELKGKIYFAAGNGRGEGLWVSDGTSYGAKLVLGGVGIAQVLRASGLIYFIAIDSHENASLWRTDGTSLGTFKLISSPQIDSGSLLAWKRKLFFTTHDDDGKKFRLRCTDGTIAGTTIVPASTASYPTFLSDQTLFGDFAYYVGTPPGASQGASLYQLDGKRLRQVAKLYGGDGDATLHRADSWLFIERTGFGATVPADGAVFRSDGTKDGTIVVRADSADDVRYSDSFTGASTFLSVAPVDKDHPNNAELWGVDNTDGKARLIKDVNPGDAGSNITFLANAGQLTYFLADDGTHGTELWRTDGTSQNTMLVADIAPNAASTSIEKTLVVGEDLYFVVNSDAGHIAVYRTDGFSPGVTKLTADSFDGVSPETLIPYGDGVLFVYRPSSHDSWGWWHADDGVLAAARTTSFSVPLSAARGEAQIIGNDLYLTTGVLSSDNENELWRIFPIS
jgi:ELWxxDGT repeat protein